MSQVGLLRTMGWFTIPRYQESVPGKCRDCGPTLQRMQYAGPGIFGTICCRCGSVTGMFQMSET